MEKYLDQPIIGRPIIKCKCLARGEILQKAKGDQEPNARLVARSFALEFGYQQRKLSGKKGKLRLELISREV